MWQSWISRVCHGRSAFGIDARLQIAGISSDIKLNLNEKDIAIVVANSGVQRGLVESEYNTRRDECKQGVEQIGKLLGQQFRSLRDVSLEQLNQCAAQLPETILKRCRPCPERECARTGSSSFLGNNRFGSIGRLINESHASLRDDFQVSCKELDLLVEMTQGLTGVLGARMMGGRIRRVHRRLD